MMLGVGHHVDKYRRRQRPIRVGDLCDVSEPMELKQVFFKSFGTETAQSTSLVMSPPLHETSHPFGGDNTLSAGTNKTNTLNLFYLLIKPSLSKTSHKRQNTVPLLLPESSQALRAAAVQLQTPHKRDTGPQTPPDQPRNAQQHRLLPHFPFLTVRLCDTLDLVLLLNSIRVGRSLSCINKFISQTLCNCLDRSKRRLSRTRAQQVQSNIDTSHRRHINRLSTHSSSRSDTRGIFTWT